MSHFFIFFVLRSELVGPRLPVDPATGQILHGTSTTFLQKLAVIDWPGLALFLVSCTAIVLALTWGGSTYAWGSPQVVALFVAGGVLFAAFLLVEYQMEPGRWLEERLRTPGKQAMIPARLFYEKDIVILAFLNFAAGASEYTQILGKLGRGWER